MPRVVGIDPGTVSIDLCGLEDGRVFLDASLRTVEALGAPEAFVARLEALGPLDLIAGPSGYGLPLVDARDVEETELRLAYLAAEGESGGIGGLRTLARAFARSALPVTFTPGVIDLPTVPAHRKVNRVDMGTADKVCAAALAIHEQATRRGCPAGEVSLILLELGGAVSAALAVIVPAPREVVLSGRVAGIAGVRETLAARLVRVAVGATVRLLGGFAAVAKQGAQGAALIADGLAGGAHATLVQAMRLRDACGTVLDHLYVIEPAAARRRLGIA